MDLEYSLYTNPAVVIGLFVVVLAIVIAIAVAVNKGKRRTTELRQRFGPEYDLAVRENHNKRKAEQRLLARVERVEHLKIRNVTAAERNRYLAEWEAVQTRFIDHPRGAVTEADEMVNALMLTCGYPVGGFEQRAADISVHHARLVDSYRRANAITVRAGKNEATTEELRTAMIHYRALFDELTGVKTPIEHGALV